MKGLSGRTLIKCPVGQLEQTFLPTFKSTLLDFFPVLYHSANLNSFTVLARATQFKTKRT